MEEEGDFCRAPALNCSLPAHVGSVVHQAVCLKTNPTLAVRKEAPRTSLGVSEGVDTAVAVLKDTGQIAAVGITVLAAAQALLSTSRYHRHPLSPSPTVLNCSSHTGSVFLRCCPGPKGLHWNTSWLHGTLPTWVPLRQAVSLSHSQHELSTRESGSRRANLVNRAHNRKAPWAAVRSR